MSKLSSLFASVLNIDEGKIGPDLSPQNTPAWDSLNAIVLIAEVQQEFNIKFSPDEVMGIKNFADIEHLVNQKTGHSKA
jgi:acyl carrier protein